jgi:hypothetical protein
MDRMNFAPVLLAGLVGALLLLALVGPGATQTEDIAGEASMPGVLQITANESGCDAVPQKCTSSVSLVSTPWSFEGLEFLMPDGIWEALQGPNNDHAQPPVIVNHKPPPRV